VAAALPGWVLALLVPMPVLVWGWTRSTAARAATPAAAIDL